MNTKLAALLFVLPLTACSEAARTAEVSQPPAAEPEATATPTAAEVDPVEHLRSFVQEFQARSEHTDNAVRVQHILIGFKGKVSGKPITRTQDEAETLTGELLLRIEAGEDFDALVKQYTDDSHPGIYLMKLKLAPGDGPANKVYQRNGMVGAFGDTGWRLKKDEVGVAAYDPRVSPYGWHIVKRTE